APDLARNELCRIVDQPADRTLRHAGEGGILLARLDRFLGGIDMDETGAGRRQRESADAGIAEQVQRFGSFTQSPAHPGPLRRHVGEEGEVAEGRALGAEAELLPAQLPSLRRNGAAE